MKVSEKGRQLHGLAEEAREGEQDFLKSLKLLDEAILAYQKDGDKRGISEALQSRSSAFKHLYQLTKDESFLVLALHNSLAGVEIAEKLKDKSGLAMAYRGTAKIFEEYKDWTNSAKFFEMAIKAFDENPPPENNRPAVRSDMKAHWAFAKYMTGDKKAINQLEEAINELTNSDEHKYNRDVWLSGAHMRMAKALYKKDNGKAQLHLLKAREIIESNPELVLRKDQLEELTLKLVF